MIDAFRLVDYNPKAVSMTNCIESKAFISDVTVVSGSINNFDII
jgi:hypothetical protein